MLVSAISSRFFLRESIPLELLLIASYLTLQPLTKSCADKELKI